MPITYAIIVILYSKSIKVDNTSGSNCKHIQKDQNEDSLVVGGEVIKTYQTGDGDGGPVGSAHEQPPQDDLVEGSI